MFAIASFWLVLLLPGYALLRLMRCSALGYGLPAAITLSYLATFALLSPLSIAGHLLNWPLWVLCAGALGAALLGAACLAHPRVRPSFRRMRPRWWAVLLGLVIAVDAVMGLRSGAHTDGDANYHLARVRMLLDFGLNSWDPLVPGHRFDAIYHTNLYHALLAASARLTSQRATEAWVYSWMFAKLATAGAIYFLSFVCTRRRVLSWISAAAFSVWMASSSVMPYPNTLAAFWLLPIALGLAIETLVVARQGRRAWPVWGLFALALVTVQVHGLYYVVWCCLVVPVIGLRTGYLLLRRRRAMQLIASLVALSAGLPWLAVSQLHRETLEAPAALAPAHPAVAAEDGREDADTETTAVEGAHQPVQLQGLDRGFIRLESGLIMLDPSALWDVRGIPLQLLAALCAGLFTVRRRRFTWLLALFVPLFVLLYAPWVCTAMVKLSGATWIVKRFVILQEVGHDAICPVAFFLLVPARFAGLALQLAAVALAFTHAWADGVDYSAWTRRAHFKRVLGHGRENFLGLHAKRRALFRRAIEREATVVARPGFAQALGIDCTCYPLAVARTMRGVSDMEQRRADALALLTPGPELDLAARLDMLRRYGARYLVVQRGSTLQALRRIYAPVVIEEKGAKNLVVLELDLSARTP